MIQYNIFEFIKATFNPYKESDFLQGILTDNISSQTWDSIKIFDTFFFRLNACTHLNFF